MPELVAAVLASLAFIWLVGLVYGYLTLRAALKDLQRAHTLREASERAKREELLADAASRRTAE